MPETYIIRPTRHAANQRGVPPAQDIIDKRVAIGFVGNIDRVRACQTIIVINEEGESKAAPIEEVESSPPMAGQTRPRVSVTFGPTRNLTEDELRTCAAIPWSSSNIRYRNIP